MSKPLFDTVCEEAVFSKLHASLSKDLHDFIYYKFGSHFNPQDKVQEAFIKLWERCKDVAPDKAKSFLFTVINNMSFNDAKHQKVVLKFQQTKPKDYTNESPEFILQEKQYLEKFEKALAKLSEGQRVAFMLNRVEGKKHQEIADMLGLSKKAVEKRIYTALKKLKEDLEEL
ncbi:RNA polymerase sigma factor [Patiriisocius sp. Uisw_017]|jgi:RNA polymerase sigma-70 factor (ECF subfamily)|uniref:RNA polymerase sigma factor n=1 Tax=Patiriisocius sp. Uisw_017 TaxID=3230968 RepID=UPI0039E7A1C6